MAQRKLLNFSKALYKKIYNRALCLVTQLCLTFLRPQGLYTPWNSSGQNPGVGSFSLLQDYLPNPGIELGSPTLQEDSLPAEPQGEAKNTGVGSLSLLQPIFPTQELNRGLIYCRQILYRLSHQGSQRILEWVAYPFSEGSSRPWNRTGVS